MPTPKHSVLDPVDIAQNHHNWTTQQIVSTATTTATGGTYDLVAPVEAEDAPEAPKKASGRVKKTK